MKRSLVNIAFSGVRTQSDPEEILGMLASVFIIIIKEHAGRVRNVHFLEKAMPP